MSEYFETAAMEMAKKIIAAIIPHRKSYTRKEYQNLVRGEVMNRINSKIIHKYLLMHQNQSQREPSTHVINRFGDLGELIS